MLTCVRWIMFGLLMRCMLLLRVFRGKFMYLREETFLMRFVLLSAMAYFVVVCGGCDSSSPSPCEILADQSKHLHHEYTSRASAWAEQARTRSRSAREIREETLQETTTTRAWFLENVFGVKNIDDATERFPDTMHGCSGPELEELRRKATLA